MTAVRAHGTRTKYVHDRCRCAPCSAANNAYSAALERAKTPGPYRLRCVGIRRLYLVTHKETKVEAFRTSDRAEAERVRAKLNAEVDLSEPLWASGGTVAAVRRHVRGLQRAGLGLKVIARAAGITPTRLGEIVRGKSYNKQRPRRRRVKAATAEKVLAVMVTAPVADGALVPAGPTWRLIDELRAAGVPKARIARELGAATPALQLRRDFVRARSARKVQALHDLACANSPSFRARYCRCAAPVTEPEWRNEA